LRRLEGAQGPWSDLPPCCKAGANCVIATQVTGSIGFFIAIHQDPRSASTVSALLQPIFDSESQNRDPLQKSPGFPIRI
jgi:hypothetical protein